MTMINQSPVIAVEYRSNLTPFEPKIIESLNALKKIPRSFLEIVALQEIKIIYFNGSITQFPEGQKIIKNTNKTYNTSNTWEKLQAYSVDSNDVRKKQRINYPYLKSGDIYIGIHGEYMIHNMSDEEIMLHEMAHSIDKIVGPALFSQRICHTPQFKEFREQISIDENNIKECFAFFFTWYYTGKSKAERTKQYYTELEKKAEEYLANKTLII